MTMWPLLLCFLLLSCAPATSQAKHSRFEAYFEAADQDPAAIPALLLEVSAHLRSVGIEHATTLADRLEPYCRRAFFSSEVIPGVQALGVTLHTVAKNEIPGRIAKQYQFAPELLALLNAGYDERRLQIGQKLRVLDLARGKLEVEVVQKCYRLGLWRSVTDESGKDRPLLLACVPVGLGAESSPTPVGSSKIEKRVRNPEWTHPVTREVFARDDPGNVLGGYWMALASQGLGKEGIGFHGYTGEAPADWIEKPASNGCVRLLQPDIERLFVVALEGTPVKLR